jgi:hypothetical protein
MQTKGYDISFAPQTNSYSHLARCANHFSEAKLPRISVANKKMSNLCCPRSKDYQHILSLVALPSICLVLYIRRLYYALLVEKRTS